MNSLLLKLLTKFRDLIDGEEGQDLVEYGLLVTLIALGAIAGMSNLAPFLTTVFTNASTSIT
jgi:pilus assembly protein Flp/PilA